MIDDCRDRKDEQRDEQRRLADEARLAADACENEASRTWRDHPLLTLRRGDNGTGHE